MKRYFNLPNSLSFVRIAMVPLVVGMLLLKTEVESKNTKDFVSYLNVLFFLIAAISDLFDGYYARKLGLTTNFGKFLDPLADKLMHLSVMVMLVPELLPAWLVVILMSRELSVTALRSMAAAEGVIIPADYWGKSKTVFLNIAISCFLLPPFFLGLDMVTGGWVFLIIATVISLGSGANYLYQFFMRSSG